MYALFTENGACKSHVQIKLPSYKAIFDKQKKKENNVFILLIQ